MLWCYVVDDLILVKKNFNVQPKKKVEIKIFYNLNLEIRMNDASIDQNETNEMNTNTYN